MNKLIILFSVLVLSLSTQAKVLKCDWRVQSTYEMDLELAPTFSFFINLDNESTEKHIQTIELDDRLIKAEIKLNSCELGEHETRINFLTIISIYFKSGFTQVYPSTLEVDFQDNTERNFFTFSTLGLGLEHSVNLTCMLLTETR